MEHKELDRNYNKQEPFYIQPKCSCGWVGKRHFKYFSNDQHESARQDYSKHLRSIQLKMNIRRGDL